ncbi:unnamed protein product [Bursaphelenchus okinawaensis]|uniref:GILT-like protein n=1 Tax=Bursaphelenchus okinawaensis TaxID=465554 RepID=A0A811KBV7_9BILA|nr:unnamed protein product [Bursaphelenchus okinawaensis]CAG9097669.1 unnamed protein product [Bursaphelenchus okinawaensis]
MLLMTIVLCCFLSANAWRPAPVAKKPTGNTVTLEVYMEAQCPDTSAFIHRQLVPTWAKLGHLQRINVTIVPFGKASCTPNGEDFSCDCQHGPTECDLNAMMNCAMERLVQPREYVPLIGCIQGSDDVKSAAAKCFSPGADKEWISQCARSKRGRYLLAMAGQRTNLLGPVFNFVPWVIIDGTRDIDSFYALEENVCKRLNSPTPAECLPGNNQQQAQAIEQPFRL